MIRNEIQSHSHEILFKLDNCLASSVLIRSGTERRDSHSYHRYTYHVGLWCVVRSCHYHTL